VLAFFEHAVFAQYVWLVEINDSLWDWQASYGTCRGARAIKSGVGQEGARIARQEGSMANVPEPEKEHDKALKADATSCVRRHRELERLEVFPHRIPWNACRVERLVESESVMETLTTAEDLLAAQVDIEGIRVLWIIGVGHGVERTRSQGEFVQNVIV
jgi:hypothetical protein